MAETKKKTTTKTPAAEKPAKEVKKVEPKVEAKKAAKETKVEKPAVTEARAISTNVRVTPRKVRLVADYIRGKKVSDALAILKRVNKVGCEPLEKVVKSAAANATNNFGMKADLLYIAEIQVGDGLKIKRYLPRAKGSASGLVKRNANIRVIVKERKEGGK